MILKAMTGKIQDYSMRSVAAAAAVMLKTAELSVLWVGLSGIKNCQLGHTKLICFWSWTSLKIDQATRFFFFFFNIVIKKGIHANIFLISVNRCY